MNYCIAIPSYKRSIICNSKTLKTLNELGIDKSKINVFVVEDEYEEYKNNLDSSLYNEIVKGKKGLVEQREFIESHYSEGTHLIMMDDDLTEIDLSLTNYNSASEFFSDAFDECMKQGAFIWGIYPVYNKFFRETKEALSTDLKYIIGCLYGIIVRNIPELKLNISREGNKEDVERSILYWLKDGKVLRYNRIAPNTKYYGTDGGGLGKLKDRLEPMERISKKINEKYPDITKIKIRKNGLYEIVLKAGNKPLALNGLKENNESPKYLTPIDPSDDLIQEIIGHLSAFKVPLQNGKGGRARTFGTHRAMTLGFIRGRKTKRYELSYNSRKHPELYQAIKKLGEKFVPFEFTAIQLNHNVVCPKHLDPYNAGDSAIISIGDYEGCELAIEGFGIFDTNCKPLMFNGSKHYHWNTPLKNGNKYSFVFFTNTH
jgi:hypothetical protein